MQYFVINHFLSLKNTYVHPKFNLNSSAKPIEIYLRVFTGYTFFVLTCKLQAQKFAIKFSYSNLPLSAAGPKFTLTLAVYEIIAKVIFQRAFREFFNFQVQWSILMFTGWFDPWNTNRIMPSFILTKG